MLSSSPDHLRQIPLIQFVYEDDLVLLKDENSEWFKILQDFHWQDHREIGALYYDALYEFNLPQSTRQKPSAIPTETQAQAKQRHLFGRPTMAHDTPEPTPILYKGQPSGDSVERSRRRKERHDDRFRTDSRRTENGRRGPQGRRGDAAPELTLR